MSTDPIKIAESKGLHLTESSKGFLRRMFEALNSDQPTIFVGQGAPGVGKSLCIAPVTAALERVGKRVMIATPTYMHLERVMIPFLRRFEVDPAISKGYGRHEIGCPLKDGVIPTPFFCRNHRELCETIDCSIKQEEETVNKSSVVVTVFQKILANPAMINQFDVAVFDESHGLEDAVYRMRTYILNFERLQEIRTFVPDSDQLVESMSRDFYRLVTAGLDEVPMTFVERFQSTCGEITKRFEAEMIRIEEEKKDVIPTRMVNLYYELSNSIYGFEHSADFRYAIYNSSVVIVPNSITFAPLHNKNLGNQTSIALISATIEEPRLHAEDAGFPNRDISPPAIIEAPPDRFRRRPIFGLVDGPVLKYDRKRLAEYETARSIANNIICQALKAIRVISLILCRSRRDAKSIESLIMKDSVIRDRVYFLPDDVEPSKLQEFINEAISSGKDVVLTSASSRFWEGVTIDNLRLVIIDALPYPSPRPFELRARRRRGDWRRSRMFRFMTRRLQQGIGRLVRGEAEWGIALVIDGRFNSQRGVIRSVLPRYLHNVFFIPKNEVAIRIQKAEKRYRT